MVKYIPDRTGRFSQRPHYEPKELDRECENIIAGFLKERLQQPSQYEKGLTNALLNGSATKFLGQLPSGVASDFYVAGLSAVCAQGDACIPAPENTSMELVERTYLSPVTATKPDYTDIIPSFLLVFQ